MAEVHRTVNYNDTCRYLTQTRRTLWVLGLLPGTETRGISPPSHQSLHRTGGLVSEAKRRRVLILKPPDLGYEVI